MSGLLDGGKISLTLVTKDGIKILHRWLNDPEYTGEYEPLFQITPRELEKRFLSLENESWWFIIDRRRFPVGFCQTDSETAARY